MTEAIDFGKLAAWARSQEPVFIVGPERSGTSMLFRAVTAHASFCSFAEATVETFAYVRPYALFEKPGPNNYEMRVYLGSQYGRFVESASPLKTINEVCDQIGISRSFLVENRKIVWNKRNYRELLRLFFYFSWINLGEKRLAEKTPAHVRALPQILDCFPKARILVCVRDPEEIIASHRKRLKREIELGKHEDDPSLNWLKKTAEHYMQYFMHVDNIVHKVKSIHPDSIMIVPYARVTRYPDILKTIFDFIGEDAKDEVVVPKEIRKKQSLKWDPLLGAMPQYNQIDVDTWLTPDERETVRRMDPEGVLKHWAVS